MKNVLVGIVFLLGTALGMLAATQVSEEIVYKIPARYLTFDRPNEMQAAWKIHNGKVPENGKLLYITGGSLGRTSGNSFSLSQKLTEKLGVPVQVHNVSTNGQRMPESFSMIEKMPESTGKEQIYVAMTYGGHRTSTHTRAALESAFNRKRMLMRHDAVRDLVENDELLTKPFVARGVEADMIAKSYLARMDKEHTASVGSHWLNYFIYDKLRKLTRKAPPKNIWIDRDMVDVREFREVRLKGVAASFARNRKSYKRSHKRYHDILVRTFTNLSPEKAIEQRDFSLFFIEKANELAVKREYSFAALELPIHSSLHNHPVVNKSRNDFNEHLLELSEKDNFPTFYLDTDIKELDVFHNWTDTGHVSPIGKYVYEKYYVDALARFLSGESGGVYGNAIIVSDQTNIPEAQIEPKSQG